MTSHGRVQILTVLSLLAAGCGSRSTEPFGDGSVSGDGINAADNTTCAKAQLVSFSGGKLTLTGSTDTSTNEYGTSINCGSTYSLMRGPQRYYRVPMRKDQTYKLVLNAQFYGARMYIFPSCGADAINAGCGSQGKTGAVSGSSSGAPLFFTPSTGGTYYVAVDSTSSSSSGAGTYSLEISEFSVPTNAKCAAAQTLTLAGGKVSVQGTTEGANNEFGTGINCGASYNTFQAPQVYYRVALTGGQYYLVSLTPDYYGARFYIFGSTCSVSAINNDCSSGGATGDLSGTTSKGSTSQVLFAPTASRTYTIAVDATSASYSGSFTLAVETYEPPGNGTCISAPLLTLSGGTVSVHGTTLGNTNEYGSAIKCGGYSALEGPQAYYKLALTGGQTYRISVQPSFSARAYLFGSGCAAAAIEADCSSNGATGNSISAYSGSTASFFYKAKQSGIHHIAVDSSSNSYLGAFDLDVSEFSPAGNGTCASATFLSIGAGGANVSGDTSGIPDEFAGQIECGGTTSLSGSQVYYRMNLSASQTYTFTLTPDFSGARMYIFKGSGCIPAAIESDCSSNGVAGDLSGYAPKGQATSFTFTPSSSDTYILAVDSTYTSASGYGPFTLAIQ